MNVRVEPMGYAVVDNDFYLHGKMENTSENILVIFPKQCVAEMADHLAEHGEPAKAEPKAEPKTKKGGAK